MFGTYSSCTSTARPCLPDRTACVKHEEYDCLPIDPSSNVQFLACSRHIFFQSSTKSTFEIQHREYVLFTPHVLSFLLQPVVLSLTASRLEVHCLVWWHIDQRVGVRNRVRQPANLMLQ